MTKFQLLAALTATNGNNIISHEGVTYHLHAIEREDGSGNKFNLTVSYAWDTKREKHKIFVKTID